jgi:biopolymer transport protein TolR
MARFGTRPKPAMNVTPLVDVVLVLLIIFMVVIPMVEQSAKVELPSVFNVDAEPKGKTDPFMLSLTASGELFFEQEALSSGAMAAKLRAANQREPSRRLVLRADRTARYADVRELFKACQEVGFPGISLRVNEVEAGGR